MVRLRTIKKLSESRRSIARVRWRVWDNVDGKVTVDESGNASDPSTWSEWEEEYFLQVDLAQAGAKNDPHSKIRPRGVIDQVLAQDLWAALNREARMEGADPDMLLEYDEGCLRALGPVVSGPWRLQCDQLRRNKER
jgi:hypothetical protein